MPGYARTWPKPVSDDDLTLMRRIDEIYMKWPFYGSRRMLKELRDERWDLNRKRVRRLMRLMGTLTCGLKAYPKADGPSHPYPAAPTKLYYPGIAKSNTIRNHLVQCPS